VTYRVTLERQIVHVEIIEKSHSPNYDRLLVNVIKSLSGDPALELPSGPKPKSVELSGTFTLNRGRFSVIERVPVCNFEGYPSELPHIKQQLQVPSPQSENQDN
jgi:hypothetical protein